MKIDLSEKLQELSKQTVHSPRKNQSSNGFDSVLQDTIEKSSPTAGPTGHLVQPLMGSIVFGSVQHDSRNVECAVAQVLLDELESYQQMLADPAATLKMIHPVVEQMEKQAAGAEELLNQMPEGHPLKMILEETLQSISQEIEKFNTGCYVDG